MVVAVLHGVEEDEANVASFLLVVVRLLDDSVKKFAAQHFLRNQIVVLRLVKDIVESNNVLVLQFLQHRNLVLQGDLVFLGQFGFRDNLDCEGPVRLPMGSLLDDRKGAFPKLKHGQADDALSFFIIRGAD